MNGYGVGRLEREKRDIDIEIKEIKQIAKPGV